MKTLKRCTILVLVACTLLTCLLVLSSCFCIPTDSNQHLTPPADTEQEDPGEANTEQSASDYNPAEPITPTRIISSFIDGIALIRYTRENENQYWGIVNTQGVIVHHDRSYADPINIGKGYCIMQRVDNDKSSIDLFNIEGDLTKSVDITGMEIIAYGDGLILIYKEEASMTAVEHYYGVLDYNGNWVLSMVNSSQFSTESIDFGSSNRAEYVGQGNFLIKGSYSYYQNYAILNANTGNHFILRDPTTDFYFNENGIAQTLSNWAINDDEPLYGLLNADGSVFPFTDNEHIYHKLGVNSNHLFYSPENDKSSIYIYDIVTSETNPKSYNVSPATIKEVSFEGDNCIVLIEGVDGNTYFSVIDHAGNELIAPTKGYNLYADNSCIVFNGEKEGFTIYHKNGSIKQIKKQASIGFIDFIYDFNDGIIITYIADRSYYIAQSYHFFDASGQKIEIREK
ncbi:MAG: hypothetical protein IJF08_09145 [Clostridia bacterium]|nr:hypothetical protein [Clostridia bacterium]